MENEEETHFGHHNSKLGVKAGYNEKGNPKARSQKKTQLV